MSWNESIGQLCTVMLHWRFAPSCFKIKITLLATLVAIRPRVRLKWCYSRRRRSDWRDVESSLSFSFEGLSWGERNHSAVISKANWQTRTSLFNLCISLYHTKTHTKTSKISKNEGILLWCGTCPSRKIRHPCPRHSFTCIEVMWQFNNFLRCDLHFIAPVLSAARQSVCFVITIWTEWLSWGQGERRDIKDARCIEIWRLEFSHHWNITLSWGLLHIRGPGASVTLVIGYYDTFVHQFPTWKESVRLWKVFCVWKCQIPLSCRQFPLCRIASLPQNGLIA